MGNEVVSVQKSAPTVFPKLAGKTPLSALSDVRQCKLDADLSAIGVKGARLLWEDREGFRFDYLWHPNPDGKRIFILFSGDAQRSKNNPPVFQRWSWAPFFPGHCLYVSDPSLFLSKDLGLAWYAGTAAFDPMPRIVELVRGIAAKLGIEASNIYSYGSSGGGFAALRMGSLFPGAGVVAVNPQTNIALYERGVERYLNRCFEGRSREQAIVEFPARLNLLEHVETLKQRRIIYVQNTLDEHHYEVHYKAFCGAMGASLDENRSNGLFRRLLFSHEGGHAKAETPEVFSATMSIIQGEYQ